MRLFITSFVAMFVFTSCLHDGGKRHKNSDDVTLATFYESSKEVKKAADKAVAYVLFPRVGKAGVGVGGAHGYGDVYEKRGPSFQFVGTSELTQIDAGLQLGAQTYSEIIFFETADAFKRFKRGRIEVSADASAVALKSGKAVHAKHDKGYTIVVLHQKGLMAEVALGGQKLSYIPR